MPIFDTTSWLLEILCSFGARISATFILPSLCSIGAHQRRVKWGVEKLVTSCKNLVTVCHATFHYVSASFHSLKWTPLMPCVPAWARSRPMTKDVTVVRSLLIGWDFAQLQQYSNIIMTTMKGEHSQKIMIMWWYQVDPLTTYPHILGWHNKPSRLCQHGSTRVSLLWWDSCIYSPPHWCSVRRQMWSNCGSSGTWRPIADSLAHPCWQTPRQCSPGHLYLHSSTSLQLVR